MATARPWHTQGWVPTWAYIPVHDASHNLVCSLYPDTGRGYTRDEVEANAALIVASVNLHEAGHLSPDVQALVNAARIEGIREGQELEREACIAIIQKIDPRDNSRDARWHVEDCIEAIRARGSK